MTRSIDGFVQVSYFTKTPFFVHFSFLAFVIASLVSTELFLANYFSNSNFLQFISFLLFCLVSVHFVKKWILSRRKFNRSPFKKLKRFIVENKFYEEEMRVVGKNKNGSPKKEKIVYNSAYFLYKETNDELIVRAWKKADKFSDKANSYDTLLSALFGLPLYKKCDEIQYCDYVFELVQDKRIIVSTSLPKNNGTIIEVTKKISYDISKVSHGIIVGGTGSGKSTYVNSKILNYAKMGAEIYIADPKSADLSLIRFVEGIGKDRVASEPNQIARILREVNEIMKNRYNQYFNDISAFGKTFVDFNLPPVVLVFDEFAAFIKEIESNRALKAEIMNYLYSIIFQGRQGGVFLEILLQRADASILDGAIRDQIGCRVALGSMSRHGYDMIFGATEIDYKTITVKGGGYIKIDGLHYEPVYFETPLIQKEFNFLEELQNIVMSHNLSATPKVNEIARQTP